MSFSSLQIVSSACVWAAEGLLRVWEFVFSLCAYRLETARERERQRVRDRDWKEKKKGRERQRLETGWGMTSWIWLRVGTAGRVCGAALSQYHIPVCKLGQAHQQQAGLCQRDWAKDVVRACSGSQFVGPSLITGYEMNHLHIQRLPAWHWHIVYNFMWVQLMFFCCLKVCVRNDGGESIVLRWIVIYKPS